MTDKNEMEFKIEWCAVCSSTYIKCPKCGNNCCGGGYGVMDKNGKPLPWNEKGIPCDVCPLAYQFQHLYNRMEQICTCSQDCICEYGSDPNKELGNLFSIMIKPNEKCPVHGEFNPDPKCPVHGEKYKPKMNKNFSDFAV